MLNRRVFLGVLSSLATPKPKVYYVSAPVTGRLSSGMSNLAQVPKRYTKVVNLSEAHYVYPLTAFPDQK